MSSPLQLCWLRGDLRLHDNHALWHASQKGQVLAVFITTPNDWRAHDDAPIKIDFWRRDLVALQAQLAERNIALRVLQAEAWDDCPELLVELAQELKASALHFNNEYGLHEQARDAAVAATFKDAGLDCQRYTDQLLFEPGSLTTQNGTMYKVYSQFRKQAYASLHRRLPDCLPAPRRQPPHAIESDQPAAGFDSFERPTDDQQALWPAGEEAALERLEHFCADLLQDYAEDRDRPDLDATSRLSAYFAAGVLSPRQCLHAALRVNQGEFDGGNPGAVSWINELLWREFYKHILDC